VSRNTENRNQRCRACRDGLGCRREEAMGVSVGMK
jgi:hypothetical protein